jgi:hypothetical protein
VGGVVFWEEITGSKFTPKIYGKTVDYIDQRLARKANSPWDHQVVGFFCRPVILKIRDSVVGIATGYGLDDRGVGVRVPVGSRIFSSPRRSDRLWGPPSILSNGYRGLLPRE